MNKQIPTDGRKFAEYVGAKPKPVGWWAQQKFLERIGVKEKATPPDLGKKFAESLKNKW